MKELKLQPSGFIRARGRITFMTLDPIDPKEYRLSTGKNSVLVDHMLNCERPFLGMVHNMADLIKLIDEHEKRWHRAKVIQIHSERLQKIHPL